MPDPPPAPGQTVPDSAGQPATVSGLFTDLYELTMANAYFAEGMAGRACFELFFRSLPPERNFVMAAGIREAVEALEVMRFTDAELAWLSDQHGFEPAFLKRLAAFRFSGDVDAVPEGAAVFPDEPVLRVEAPILEAQLVETLVLNRVHFASLIASKAARMVLAAQGRDLVDFGSRRAHGTDAALGVARASYLAGFTGTSNVLAGMRFGIPTVGTMAHSYIQAHAEESEAFAAFARRYPGTTLLVDTYDTIDGVERVITLARSQGEDERVGAIRLDSGDLAELSREARARLDAADLSKVRIIASGGLDEHAIAGLIARQAPIDGFGVGTKLAVSADAPDLDFAYKLVAYEGRPTAKRSPGKAYRPGRKQVYRRWEGGRLAGDTIAAAEPDPSGRTDLGEPMLIPVMRGGRCLPDALPDPAEARRTARTTLASLPESLAGLETANPPYPVDVSDRISSAS